MAVGKLLGEAEGMQVARSVHTVVSRQGRKSSCGPLKPHTYNIITIFSYLELTSNIKAIIILRDFNNIIS